MKISLNKANKIRNLLENHVQEIFANVHSYNHVNLNGFESSSSQVLAKVQENSEKTKQIFNDVVEGNKATFALRNLIQKTNHDCGINDVISEISRLNALLQFYSQTFHSEIDGETHETIMDKIRVNTQSRTGSSLSSVPYRVINSIDSVWYNLQFKEIAKIKKKIRELEEKRNELNHKNVVEIPDEIESYLAENDLI